MDQKALKNGTDLAARFVESRKHFPIAILVSSIAGEVKRLRQQVRDHKAGAVYGCAPEWTAAADALAEHARMLMDVQMGATLTGKVPA
jgi:hypothetical protein